MSKNILVLNYEFPPLGGGQGNANYFLFKEFSKLSKYNFTLITSSTSIYREEKFSKNIQIYYLDVGKNNKNLHNQSVTNLLINAYKTYKLSQKLIKQSPYDSIMAWSYPAIGISTILNKKYDLPYLSLLRGSDVPFYEKKWKYLDKFVFKSLAPVLWEKSKYVIANSKGLKQLASRISPKQEIHIIPNGVDTSFYRPDISKKIQNKFIILGVGRLVERKGFDILIKAVGEIESNKPIEIWLAGDGPEHDSLIKLARDNGVTLKLLGLNSKEQLKTLYQQVDIFCLPSKNEGMSNTLLEAIASGLPVIVTNVGGSEELVTDNGYIIEINNTQQLKEKIKYLYTNPDKIMKLSEASMKKATHLSWNNTSTQFLKYL